MNPFTGFSHIYLPVRDVDESIDFYTKNLGFRLLRKYTLAEGAAPSAYLELGEVLLELTKARRPLPAEEGNVEPRIGLAVTDMDAAWADLTSKGVEPVREPYDARTFWGGGGGGGGGRPRSRTRTATASLCANGRHRTSHASTTGSPSTPV